MINKKGEITIKELIGTVLFILVLVLVFSPLVSKLYGIFKATSNEEKAEAKLNEIIYQINDIVKNNKESSSNVLMDEPLDWFLVGNEKNELCICWTLARDKESQDEICKEYGGFCSNKIKHSFSIDNPITDNKRGGSTVGRRDAIKLEGDNFLVIQNEDGKITFRKSVTESKLNEVLNEFLDSEIYYSGEIGEGVTGKIGVTHKKVLEDFCSGEYDYYDEFKSSFNNYFSSKGISKSNTILLEIGHFNVVNGNDIFVNDISAFDLIYPISVNSIDFKRSDYIKTYKRLNEDCVIYLYQRR